MIPLLRRTLPFLIAAIVLAGLYDGWFFYSRWREDRGAEWMLEAKQVEDARRTIALLGGGELKILSFYASPGSIRRGDHTNICYGVYGAKSVRIEPPMGELYPAVAYCLQVSPSKSTEYKLVAKDASGHVATQGFVLHVAP